ncbi:nuclear transport factor 2 family protein [Variovorax sp. J22P271]|uniref:nuclear transport factor 2 family protein n=1 Tax=Variovorax davisae TaxID=3053515 RepID=UPI0025772A9B|nr:nuclear transport factor 2 family protein [Variovorax sp. J22P271]MDM0032418.1 nuclear transport factor 2 family protein [Variovorax sp. J22P271]
MSADLLPGGVTPQERAHVEALIIDGAWRVDHGQADTVWEQCTEDAVLFGMRPNEDIVGREAIKAWGRTRASAQRTTRHVVTNVRVYRDASGDLRSTSTLTMYRHEGSGTGSAAPFMVGDYEDKYEQNADGRLLMAERRIVWAFMSPNS